MKSLLIKWSGFTCCLLNTVAIKLWLYLYSFSGQAELLSQDELKELVCRMLEHQPSLVMTLLEKDDPEHGYHPEPSLSTKSNRCKCTNCVMKCQQNKRKRCGYVTGNCLSKHPVSSMSVSWYRLIFFCFPSFIYIVFFCCFVFSSCKSHIDCIHGKQGNGFRGYN